MRDDDFPIGATLRASAQTPSTGVSFEVATIKPVDPSFHFDGTHYWAHINGAGASYWYMTLVNLVCYAYGVQSFQVTAPDWASTVKFDTDARFPEGADQKDERKMLQSLLEDRFKLTFHIESRQLDSYVLVVGKNGQKLKPSLPDPISPELAAPLNSGDNNPSNARAKPAVNNHSDGSATVNMGKRGTMMIKLDWEHWAQHFELSRVTINDFAKRLSPCLTDGEHKIIDETGIKGSYQVAYDCPLPGRRPSAAKDAADTLPADPQGNFSLIQSLDALGLKLEKRKLPMDVYLIDHVERPSEN